MALLSISVATFARDDAAGDRSVDVFLRGNKLWFRVPDGPEYKASIRSADYASYATERSAACVRPPEPTHRTEVLQFYKPSQGANVGRLHLEVLVSPAGIPVAVDLLESPGALAVYSAVHSLRDWRFDPGRTTDGQPTYCRHKIVFQFVVTGG